MSVYILSQALDWNLLQDDADIARSVQTDAASVSTESDVDNITANAAVGVEKVFLDTWDSTKV